MLDVAAEAETKKSYFFFPVNSNNKWYNPKYTVKRFFSQTTSILGCRFHRHKYAKK